MKDRTRQQFDNDLDALTSKILELSKGQDYYVYGLSLFECLGFMILMVRKEHPGSVKEFEEAVAYSCDFLLKLFGIKDK
jgi:hypothetical protein